MKRDEGGEVRPSLEELEGMSFDDLTAGLTDVTMTRSRAIKLAGAALAGSALTLLWPGVADARRKRRRRKRRRKATVTPNPLPTTQLVPGVLTLNVTNPSDERDLTVSGVQFLNGDGGVISTQPLVGGPVTIDPNTDADVTVNLDPDDPLINLLLDAEGLRLLDAGGDPITILNSPTVTPTVIPVGL